MVLSHNGSEAINLKDKAFVKRVFWQENNSRAFKASINLLRTPVQAISGTECKWECCIAWAIRGSDNRQYASETGCLASATILRSAGLNWQSIVWAIQLSTLASRNQHTHLLERERHPQLVHSLQEAILGCVVAASQHCNSGQRPSGQRCNCAP